MNISFVEIDITIRPVDRRNAPITTKTIQIHGQTHDVRACAEFKRLHLPKEAAEEIHRILDEAERKPDPYTDGDAVPPASP